MHLPVEKPRSVPQQRGGYDLPAYLRGIDERAGLKLLELHIRQPRPRLICHGVAVADYCGRIGAEALDSAAAACGQHDSLGNISHRRPHALIDAKRAKHAAVGTEQLENVHGHMRFDAQLSPSALQRPHLRDSAGYAGADQPGVLGAQRMYRGIAAVLAPVEMHAYALKPCYLAENSV